MKNYYSYKEFQELIEKYKYVLDEMDSAQREYNEFMEKESVLELNKVKFDDLPDDIDATFIHKIKKRGLSYPLAHCS